MIVASSFFVSLTLLLHVFFLVLEMFLWTKPYGLKAFHQTFEQAKASAALAKNQGLYNGFLAAGLLWGLVSRDQMISFQVQTFFLVCVIIAGVFGALTVNRRIFFMQALPAILGLAFVILGSHSA